MSQRFNWPLWTGFALSIAAFVSYFLLFYRFPITRDVPWPSFILFAVAMVLLAAGLRRAAGRKIVAWVVTVLGVVVCASFCFAIFIGSKQLPPSGGAPAAGTKAPGFVLLDTNRRPVALAGLLAAPGSKGVLLIFYRGYW
ncbi:MAG TPA: hypothetical protein VNN08_15515 [Thermoanaerobaculia bacterium]|nr:hypothetical protein [Thermoanaerobaculia bacterium]